MGTASKLFYLAVFTLLNPSRADSHGSKLKAHQPGACAIDPKATVSDACASYSTLDHLNERIAPLIQSLTQETDFFSYYRLNLFNRQCPFWTDDSGMCGNVACAVNTLESEDDIPPIWRAEELSKLEGPKAGHPGKKLQQERPREKPLQGMLGEGVGETCVFEYDDECDERDYCVPEDEGATAKGDYVSLLDNPERFTGYSGPGARHVWDSIYRENCFLKSTAEVMPQSFSMAPGGLQAAKDFRNVLQRHGRDPNAVAKDEGYLLDDECLEKRVFHRLISGMHASISTHLCWDYFNQTTGQWLPNLQCYKERLRDHPERLSNLYFDFALLVRAVSKLRRHLEVYKFCIDDPDQDDDTSQKMNLLTNAVASHPQIFDESIMFQDAGANGLKEDFRNRFRNVSRLMDCIGCDKCRLWGKVQTAGYGAALKVLFEFDETKDGENPRLRRTELVALINTLGRVSNSLNAVQQFEKALASGTSSALPIHSTVPESPLRRKAGADKNSKNGHQKAKKKDSSTDNPKKKVEADDDDAFPDFPEDPGWQGKDRRRGQSQSIADAFWEEWDLVWRAYVFVLKSWFGAPKKLYHIFIMEMNRLWNYWLGLPVPPRSWDIRFPTHREL